MIKSNSGTVSLPVEERIRHDPHAADALQTLIKQPE